MMNGEESDNHQAGSDLHRNLPTFADSLTVQSFASPDCEAAHQSPETITALPALPLRIICHIQRAMQAAAAIAPIDFG